jgi:HD superfamily phosphodiesterase
MNDIHLPLTLLFAEFLLDAHPEADPQVTRVAAMLHDAGWARVDESKILSEGFRSDNFMTSDVRVQHEIYGCDIAREILPGCGYDDEFIKKVTDIIDGHDTRPESHSIEDSIMRDADRLWRFNPVGLGFSAEWFGKTPQQIRLKLEQDIMPEMITPTGRAMAEAELQHSIRVLCLDVL